MSVIWQRRDEVLKDGCKEDASSDSCHLYRVLMTLVASSSFKHRACLANISSWKIPSYAQQHPRLSGQGKRNPKEILVGGFDCFVVFAVWIVSVQKYGMNEHHHIR